MSLSILILSLFSLFPLSSTTNLFENRCPATISRVADVAIIGGGAAGTYAALRLQQHGISVALIEQQAVLGGHVSTFHDPETGRSVDFGVISYGDTKAVRELFAYLDVPLAARATARNIRSKTVHANLQGDGRIVPLNSTTRSLANALLSFKEQVGKYPFLASGFHLPQPLPEDLLLPFGVFVHKYGLEDLVEFVFVWMGGLPYVMEQTTLYIMKSLSEGTLDSFLGSGPAALTTAGQNNQELYDKALERLAGDTFLESRVDCVSRSKGMHHIIIQTASGAKLVFAQRLLIAVPPQLSTVESWGMDLDSDESELLRQFTHNYYWVMVIRNSGVPDDISVVSTDPNAPLSIPKVPRLYFISAAGITGYHIAYFSSPSFLSDDQVRSNTLTTLSRLLQANAYVTSGGSETEIVAFRNHSPYGLQVSLENLHSAFYDKLNGLQGRRETWWAGAAWEAQDSALIWDWMEKLVLPQLIATL